MAHRRNETNAELPTLNFQPRTSARSRSQTIQRAFHPAAALAHDMGVYHRSGDIFMAQQFLDRPDVRSGLQSVRGKTVTERMAAHALLDSHPRHRRLDRPVNRRFVQMMPPHHPRPGILG